jgi:hypothetical protein
MHHDWTANWQVTGHDQSWHDWTASCPMCVDLIDPSLGHHFDRRSPIELDQLSLPSLEAVWSFSVLGAWHSVIEFVTTAHSSHMALSVLLAPTFSYTSHSATCIDSIACHQLHHILCRPKHPPPYVLLLHSLFSYYTANLA